MNGLLSKIFRKFSLIDKICQCLSITFLMLGNVLLKIASPYFPTGFFDLHSWLFQYNGLEF